jgi:hypothetical protein
MALLPLSNVFAAVIDGHMVIHADATGDMTVFEIVGESCDDNGTQTFALYHPTVGCRTLVAYDGGIAQLSSERVKLATPIQFFDTSAPMEADEADIVECMRVLSHSRTGAHCHV